MRPFPGSCVIAAGAAFTPAAIDDLAFWYDIALSDLTLDGSSLVSAISDLSGNGNDAAQSNGSLRGAVLTSQFGPLPALDVNSDWYAAGAAAVGAAGTYFAVAKSDDDGLGAMIGIGATSNSVNGAMMRFLTDSFCQMIIGDGTARANSTLAAAYTVGSVVCAVGRWNATTVDLQVNGVDASQGVHSLGSLGTSGVQVCTVTGGGNALDGKWAAGGYYTRRLTDGEVDDLMEYLQGRFA
jgi:hypothetical protein